MTLLLTLPDVQKIIQSTGLVGFFDQLIDTLEGDFKCWQQFQKTPRIASHVPNGVIELMPTCNSDFYSCKYVNGHPNNPKKNLMTVIGLGLLADPTTGYPLLLSEMTLLTAIRTAATAALAAKHLANLPLKKIAIIGTGAQAEFQVLALTTLSQIETVSYYDKDPKAMAKFHNNLKNKSFKLIPCDHPENGLKEANLVITATASAKSPPILQNNWVSKGMHINAIGGDCPGKTELDPEILQRARTFVEYAPQTRTEGEIQNKPNNDFTELWEVISKKKPGRENPHDITLFDSVGFAIEDFSTLKLIYHLAKKMGIGQEIPMTPVLEDPKNLFSLLEN